MAEQQSAWRRIIGLCRLIYLGSGHADLPVRAYGGQLFRPGDAQAPDPVLRALGALEAARPSDATVYRLLRLLKVGKVKVRAGRGARLVAGAVDFGDLRTEYVGIVYEGLLDYELRRPAVGPSRGRAAGGEAVSDARLPLGRGSRPALPRRDPAGVPRGARARLRLPRRRPRARPLRQPALGGPEGPARPPPRGAGPLRGAALPLSVRVIVHDARDRRRAREGRRRGGGRTLSARPPRARPPRRELRGARLALRTRLRSGSGAADRGQARLGRGAALGGARADAPAAERALRLRGELDRARQPQGARHGAPEPLLGAGLARRAKGPPRRRPLASFINHLREVQPR